MKILGNSVKMRTNMSCFILLQITLVDVSAVDKKLLNIGPQLSTCKPENCYYEETKFQWVKLNRPLTTRMKDVYILSVSTSDNVFDPPKENIVQDGTNEGNNNEFKIEFLDTEETQEFDDDNDNWTSNDTQNVNSNDAQNINSNDAQSKSTIDSSFYYDDEILYESDTEVIDDGNHKKEIADGSSLDQDYANTFLLSESEQKAASEVYRMFSNGKHKCKICKKGYNHEKRLEVHMRMHEKVKL